MGKRVQKEKKRKTKTVNLFSSRVSLVDSEKNLEEVDGTEKHANGKKPASGKKIVGCTIKKTMNKAVR